ncbi:hypothetical protein BMETH_3111191367, partial [methanotrophic bacterial endosymbiont of Bathymodiolus sp.]
YTYASATIPIKQRPYAYQPSRSLSMAGSD